MHRFCILSIIVLILSGCGTTGPEGQSAGTTAVSDQLTGSAELAETAMLPASASTPEATATTSVDTVADTNRATLTATWQQANQGVTEATALLYFGPNTSDGTTLYAAWRFPLQEDAPPQRIAEVAWTPLGTPVGNLSPDEQWVAYIIGDQPTPGFELHLLRVNGSSDQVISVIGIHSDCAPAFAWLQADSTLIYIAGTIGVRAYDPMTTNERVAIPYERAGSLVGIDHKDRVIMAVLRQPHLPRDIVAVDPTTGAQEVLAPLPRPAMDTLFCRKVSPDGSQLLFAMGESPYQSYLFDSTTRQTREIDVVPNHTFWASDSQHILTSGAAVTDITVRALPDMTTVSTAVLPPAAPGLENPAVLGTSPDGQWLVGCYIGATEQQSWLYHFPTQRWQMLAAGDECINVVGWTKQ
ncbi:MAG: hypothetical protein ACLFVO_06215 [Chloroflexaceae bacterium]